MGQSIFKKSLSNGYWHHITKGYEEYILENFLISDVGCSSQSINEWINWLGDNQELYASSNLTFIGKEENDIIELYDILTLPDNIIDDTPRFRLKKTKLIELLQTWEKLNQEKPNFIVITIDGDNITMEGKENDLS